MLNKKKKSHFEYFYEKVEHLHNSNSVRSCDRLCNKIERSYSKGYLTSNEYDYLHEMIMLYITDKSMINFYRRLTQFSFLSTLLFLIFMYLNYWR